MSLYYIRFGFFSTNVNIWLARTSMKLPIFVSSWALDLPPPSSSNADVEVFVAELKSFNIRHSCRCSVLQDETFS